MPADGAARSRGVPPHGGRAVYQAGPWCLRQNLKVLLKRYFEAMVGFTQPFFITP